VRAGVAEVQQGVGVAHELVELHEPAVGLGGLDRQVVLHGEAGRRVLAPADAAHLDAGASELEREHGGRLFHSREHAAGDGREQQLDRRQGVVAAGGGRGLDRDEHLAGVRLAEGAGDARG
jgi:hypothetical protein